MAKIIIDPFTGMKHLEGSSFCSFVTMCGEVDCFERETIGGRIESAEGKSCNGLPNCQGCIDVAEMIFRSITKSELNKAKKEKNNGI